VNGFASVHFLRSVVVDPDAGPSLFLAPDQDFASLFAVFRRRNRSSRIFQYNVRGLTPR
jgi:hypothetical protein